MGADHGLEHGPGVVLSGTYLTRDMHWQLKGGTLLPYTRNIARGVQVNIHL